MIMGNPNDPNDQTIILIPSLEPDERLPSYVRQLRGYGLTHIVVVDDGSGEAYQPIFRELAESGCIVLRHPHNRGKGAALKTGLRCIEREFPSAICIVTADSDGQHAAEDVYRLAEEAKRHPDALLLGTRDFSLEGIPPKSLLGNRLSAAIFALLYGKRLSDTQTGLRAFGPQLLAMMQAIRGTRFEYELQMLIACTQSGIPIVSVPIRVIYENGNAGTHFKAIRDSARVMGVLFGSFFRFISSSVASSVVDLGIAWVLIDGLRPLMGEHDFGRILLATAIARALSIGVNYGLNRNFVFRKERNSGTLWRYLALSLLIMLGSGIGVYGLHALFLANEKAAKIVCDALLFLFSFYAQRRWVFAGRRQRQQC
ncbi:bifunctional glycosyltransferase family 2/GtrA family protein [Cohnella fermenti]|uniref:Glycosyltransferase n=1 Tax=Cohnella fermenti TaxID=2565925 RepID=A0A4S4BHK6_9BACL|nr:bifunctional glycosyltransferase family 2/GtrA family protein [Cohnella fermenti]THF74050.1 glycosyltransferase [Cohnella fermenti]